VRFLEQWIKLLKDECEGDEMSLEELFDLTQTIDDDEDIDRIKINYSNLIKLIINNVLKQSKQLLLSNISQGSFGDEMAEHLGRKGVTPNVRPLTRKVTKN